MGYYWHLDLRSLSAPDGNDLYKNVDWTKGCTTRAREQYGILYERCTGDGTISHQQEDLLRQCPERVKQYLEWAREYYAPDLQTGHGLLKAAAIKVTNFLEDSRTRHVPAYQRLVARRLSLLERFYPNIFRTLLTPQARYLIQNLLS